jgi:hypothetical protein
MNEVKEMFNVTEVLKSISKDVEYLADSLSNPEEHNRFLYISEEVDFCGLHLLVYETIS